MPKVKVPASVASLDLDRVRRAMFKADGNVTKAAKALKVSAPDLRRLTWRHPTLVMDALEQVHRMIDKAEENLRRALHGDHPELALRASIFVLSHHAAARERGWGRSSAGFYVDPRAPQTLVVRWEGDVGYQPGAPAFPEGRAPDPPEDRRRH